MSESAAGVVHAFLDAVEAFDFGVAARYLDPARFTYRSPLNSYDSVPEFMAEFSRLGSILKHIERRHSLSDGREAALFLDIQTHVPDFASSSRIALWAEVGDGKIAALEFYYDARAYMAMFEPG